MTKLTPDILLQAYRMGIFPMAKSRDAHEFEWYDPHLRGILPLDAFHVPRKLQRIVRQNPYSITFDKDFRRVMTACANARPDTWINDAIIDLYTQTAERGFAHSVEAWAGDDLVGGLYGISIGGAFFGESMFSTATNASKIALVHLVERLRAKGFVLLDTQFTNNHLLQFGVIEIPRAEYHARLKQAVDMDVTF